MIIAVIDGLGGSIGKEVISRLRKTFSNSVEIIALGTNAVAVNNMMKAGANKGASGENAIRVSVKDVDVIITPVSLLIPDSMMGEVTKVMAEAIATSSAEKIILPLSQPKIRIIGVSELPLPHLLDEAVLLIEEKLKESLPEGAKEVKSDV